MKWQGRRGSDNVEDRRGMSTGTKVVGGGVGTIVIVLIVLLLGGDPSSILDQTGSQTTSGPVEATEEENQMAQFVSVVLADTEEIWTQIFAQSGSTYRQTHARSVQGPGAVSMRVRHCRQRSILLPRR